MKLRASWSVVAAVVVVAAACGHSDREFGSGASGSGAGEGGAPDAGGAPGAAGGTGDTDLCLGVVCDAPPASSCESSTELETYDTTGSCSEGQCSYVSRLIACDCSEDACTSDPCSEVDCDSPPATVCKDRQTLTEYDASGECSAGSCSYAPSETSCEANLECLDGACQCTIDSCGSGCCSAGACGSCAPTTLLTRTEMVRDLTIKSPLLFFLEGTSGPSVYSLPSSGGQPALLSYPPPSSLNLILADGSYVYGDAIGSGYPRPIARMDMVGGPFVEMEGDVTYGPASMRANSSSIFVGSTLSSGYIWSVPKGGGSVLPLVSSPAVNIQKFAVDDAFLYFIASGGTSISRIPVLDGDIGTVTAADADEKVTDVVLADDQVVFASSTRLGKAPAVGGAAETLDLGPVYALVADSSEVFFFRAKGNSATCASGSELFSIPLAGGPLRRLATEPTTSCVRSLVQDESAVYWLADRLIRRAMK